MVSTLSGHFVLGDYIIHQIPHIPDIGSLGLSRYPPNGSSIPLHGHTIGLSHPVERKARLEVGYYGLVRSAPGRVEHTLEKSSNWWMKSARARAAPYLIPSLAFVE
jgi:hypothetical protein